MHAWHGQSHMREWVDIVSKGLLTYHFPKFQTHCTKNAHSLLNSINYEIVTDCPKNVSEKNLEVILRRCSIFKRK